MEVDKTSENLPSTNSEPCPEVKASESEEVEKPSSEPAVESQIAQTSVPTTSDPEAPSTEDADKLPNGLGPKKQIDYNSMSAGVYLDATVVPILQVALVTLNRLR